MNTHHQSDAGGGFLPLENPRFETLLQVYNDLHFIYPAKIEKLAPVLDRVKKNWENALQLGFPEFCSTVVKSGSPNNAATVTVWRYLNRGMIGQHLASGHPLASREVLLSVLGRVIAKQDECKIDSFQIFYRPENKYPNRMFRMVAELAGERLSAIQGYDYFHLPASDFRSESLEILEASEANRDSWFDFLRSCRSATFINVQELDGSDIELTTLNARLKEKNLYRGRKLLFARRRADNVVCGMVIINMAPVGLNFSFLENAAELILDNAHDDAETEETAKALLSATSSVASIVAGTGYFVLTDPVDSALYKRLGGEWIRSYHLFMIVKAGYHLWYNCIEALTNAVFERRLQNNKVV